MKAIKKWLYLIFLCCVMLIPTYASAKTIVAGEKYGTYAKAQEMVKEVMKQYYIRGPYFQYNYAKATYGKEAPEEATSQDNKYAVCAAYTYDVYAEAFGMYYSTTSTFPRYNYNIVEDAYDKYYSDKNNLDGNFLIYYESTTNTTSTYKDNSQARKREVVKYVYGDNNTSSDSGDFETLVNNVKPGDLFVYSGHALIAYDVVVNPNTNKKDVLILNSTADEYIRTRIESTSKISYNFFKNPNGNNGFLDIDKEGTFQWFWLSNSSHFLKNGELKCQEEECAVIRPFYEKDGQAVFNYDINTSQYNKGNLRTQYPGLFIEKTVNVNDNDSVYLGDTLKYTIKITNKSNVTPNSTSWNSFVIEEKISDYVEYISSTNKGSLNSNKIIWTISGLEAGKSIELTYTVKVKEKYSNVFKTIEASGSFYSKNNSTVFLSTGTVKNKIIPKTTNLKNSYSTCYINNKDKYSDLELINKIYICATGVDFNFGSLSFESMFTTKGTSKSNSRINFSSNLDTVHNNIKNMILNDYFNALVKSTTGNYFLPPFTSSSATRAKTINPSDFKDGDVLIYSIESSKFTDEDGIYAYIYLNGKFVGMNGTGTTLRNQFDYNYYESTNKVSSSTCKRWGYTYGSECNYAYNLYGGYTKLASVSSVIKQNTLEFVNFQTLFDKNYYMILRPETVIKEIGDIAINAFPKQTYIQNYENLDLTGGTITVSYNDGTTDTVSLMNKNVKVTGFDNSKIGINTITVEYKGHTTTFNVEIISKQLKKIKLTERPIKINYIENYENLDLTGGIITVTYNDGTTDTVSLTNENVKVSGFDNSKIGTNTITVEYEGHTTTFNVEIISKKLEKIKLAEKPTKIKYIQNSENLDLTGGTITLSYNDGTTNTVSLTNNNVKVTGFDNSKIGTNTITVQYEGHTTTFNVEIISKKLEKIEVTEKPIKINYIPNFENLDLTGGIITVSYNDGTTDTVSLTNENVKVSGFDNSKIGTNTITVEYEGHTTTFNVEIISKQLKKIEVTQKPIKINYIPNYETLDLTGGLITVTYHDETTDTVSLTNENVKVTGFDNSKIGTNTITVEYEGHTTMFNVEIISKQLEKIEVIQKPLKINYIQNDETLDLTGGVITVTYNDGTTDTVSLTNHNVKVTGFDNSKIGTNTITVEYGGHTTIFDVEILSGEPIIDNSKTEMLNIIVVFVILFMVVYLSYVYIQSKK